MDSCSDDGFFVFGNSVFDPHEMVSGRKFPPEDRNLHAQNMRQPLRKEKRPSTLPDLDRIRGQARNGAIVSQGMSITGKDDSPGAFDGRQTFSFLKREFLVKRIVEDLKVDKTSDNDGKADHDQHDCDRCPSFHDRSPGLADDPAPPVV